MPEPWEPDDEDWPEELAGPEYWLEKERLEPDQWHDPPLWSHPSTDTWG